ncbi:hypothetical protein ES703_68628 [subsurface metagenome]
MVTVTVKNGEWHGAMDGNGELESCFSKFGFSNLLYGAKNVGNKKGLRLISVANHGQNIAKNSLRGPRAIVYGSA